MDSVNFAEFFLKPGEVMKMNGATRLSELADKAEVTDCGETNADPSCCLS